MTQDKYVYYLQYVRRMNKITELETQQSLREVTEHFEVDLRTDQNVL